MSLLSWPCSRSEFFFFFAHGINSQDVSPLSLRLSRIIAFGFLQNQGAYLRDSWNCLDFVIVIVSVVDVLSTPAPMMSHVTQTASASFGALKALRALRALRPLRAARAFPGIRVVVNAIFSAIPPCFNVFMLALAYFCVAAIVFQNLMGGKLKSCNDPTRTCVNTSLVTHDCPMERGCVGYYAKVLDFGDVFHPEDTGRTVYLKRAWENPSYGNRVPSCNDEAIEKQFAGQALAVRRLACNGTFTFMPEGEMSNASAITAQRFWGYFKKSEDMTYSFDYFGVSLLTLFEIATLEMYLEIVYNCQDITTYNQAPVPHSSDVNVWIFVVHILLGSFLFMNLFVSVIIDNFQEVKDRLTNSAFLTPAQKQWIKAMKQATTTQVVVDDKPPEGWTQNQIMAWEFVQQESFENCIMGFIGLNFLMMMCEFPGQPDTMGIVFNAFNYTFAAIFIAEAVIKIYGLGAERYFSDSFNCFDFSIVVINLAVMIYEAINVAGGGKQVLFVSLEGSEYQPRLQETPRLTPPPRRPFSSTACLGATGRQRLASLPRRAYFPPHQEVEDNKRSCEHDPLRPATADKRCYNADAFILRLRVPRYESLRLRSCHGRE